MPDAQVKSYTKSRDIMYIMSPMRTQNVDISLHHLGQFGQHFCVSSLVRVINLNF